MIEESFFNINFQTDSIEKSSIERPHHNKRIKDWKTEKYVLLCDVWTSSWQCVRTLFQDKLSYSQDVMLQVRRPVNLPNVEHKCFPILRTELLTQSSHIVVSKIPLFRAEVLQTLGGFGKFRLHADHYRPRALESSESI